MAAEVLGPVRKALQLDDLRTMEKMLKTFVKVCEEHPELIVEYHMGAYTRARCAEADAGERKGAKTQHMLELYKIQAEGIIERVLNAKGEK